MGTSNGLKTWYLTQCGVKNWESARDVYSKRRIIAVTKLQTVKWHNYKHLDWITMRRDDDKLYKFKEGDFKRLRIQDIEDMLLLLVQGKLTNLTVEERFAVNVSLRMFTRSIVIKQHVEDLQLGYSDEVYASGYLEKKQQGKSSGETSGCYNRPYDLSYDVLIIQRTLKDGGEGTCFLLSQRFIAACAYPTIKYKDIMKAQ
nr:hypothetical protein [Tanacetum cinerariifolium]